MADDPNNVVDEDEDLFDFPDMMPAMPEPAPAVQASEASEVEGENAASEPAAPLPAASAAPVAEAAAAAPTGAGAARALVPPKPAPAHDPEADADLFEFDELFQPADDLADPGTLSHADLLQPEPPAPVPASSAAAVPTPAPTPAPAASAATLQTAAPSTPSAPSAAAAPVPTATADAGWASLGLPPIISDAQSRARDAAASARAAAERKLRQLDADEGESLRARLPLVAAGVVFVAMNAAMVFFAWRASDSLDATLDGVRGDVARTLAGLDVGGEVHAEAPSTPAPSEGGSEDPENQLAEVVEGYGASELRAAREEIQLGEYVAARLRLFRLLANRDRGPLDDAVVSDAEYTIARSYFVEGERLGEAGR